MNLSPGYPQWENGYRDRYQKNVLRKRFLKLGIILLVIVSIAILSYAISFFGHLVTDAFHQISDQIK